MMLLPFPEFPYAPSVVNPNYLTGHVPIAGFTRDVKLFQLKRFPEKDLSHLEVIKS